MQAVTALKHLSISDVQLSQLDYVRYSRPLPIGGSTRPTSHTRSVEPAKNMAVEKVRRADNFLMVKTLQ